MNEDDLRAAMRAHDDDAPRADEFPTRPIRRRRALPTAAAVIVTAAVVAVIALVWTRPAHPHPAALGNPTDSSSGSASYEPSTLLTCPHRYTAPAYPHVGAVPARARGFDATARLVPPIEPTAVVVCSYPTRRGKASALQSSRQLDGGLNAVANALAWAGPAWPSMGCAGVAMTPSPAYLIGVTYRHARVWVSVPGLTGGCAAGASNGAFKSSLSGGKFAQRALSTGRWPHARLPAGRLGQETHMVPGQPSALTIYAGVVHRTYAEDKRHPGQKRTLTTGFDDLITALNSAAAQKSTDGCSHSPRPGAKVYQLTFAYPEGPPVALNIMQGCYPEVDNGSLQIRDSQQFFPLIDQLLR